ncbi:hypothetical protein PM082_024954 [Marasmius tenuissimus]|nr:hypothetical protein PM082_024954 [Marasmius tenuissimus]
MNHEEGTVSLDRFFRKGKRIIQSDRAATQTEGGGAEEGEDDEDDEEEEGDEEELQKGCRKREELKKTDYIPIKDGSTEGSGACSAACAKRNCSISSQVFALALVLIQIVASYDSFEATTAAAIWSPIVRRRDWGAGVDEDCCEAEALLIDEVDFAFLMVQVGVSVASISEEASTARLRRGVKGPVTGVV